MDGFLHTVLIHIVSWGENAKATVWRKKRDRIIESQSLDKDAMTDGQSRNQSQKSLISCHLFQFKIETIKTTVLKAQCASAKLYLNFNNNNNKLE